MNLLEHLGVSPRRAFSFEKCIPGVRVAPVPCTLVMTSAARQQSPTGEREDAMGEGWKMQTSVKEGPSCFWLL